MLSLLILSLLEQVRNVCEVVKKKDKIINKTQKFSLLKTFGTFILVMIYILKYTKKIIDMD